MSWLLRRYSSHVSSMYRGGVYDHPDKLETFWPLILGGIALGLIEWRFGPDYAGRSIVFFILLLPGFLWAILLLFHEFRSLPGRYRRQKNLSKGSE